MKFASFLVIALLVALPLLLSPGYLVLLDWQGTPYTSLLQLDQTSGVSGISVRILTSVIGLVGGAAFAQKILILLILACAGYATMLLVENILPKETPRVIPYTAGVFAMLNPFVYNRLEMGHVYLLAAYALSPFAVLSLLRFMKTPSVRTGLEASMVWSLVIATSIHHIVLLPILLACVAWHEWRKPLSILKRHYAALAIPFLCTILLIFSVTSLHPASALRGLTQDDLHVFSPVPQCSQSVLLDTALLTAQWKNTTATHPPCTSPLFFGIGILLLCIIAIGAFAHRRLALGALVLIALSAFPLLPILRDSAKFLSCLALLECILLAYGMLRLSEIKRYAPHLACMLVCVAGFPMFGGLSGSIIPRIYPSAWYAWDAKLATLEEKPRVLFLPWHLYMPFDFTNGATIGNPAVLFFTHADVIQGDNLEIRQENESISTESTRPISRAVEATLSEMGTPAFSEKLKTLLQNEHITYIALAHGSPEEAIYRDVLGDIPYMQIEQDNPGLTIWRFTK